MKLYNNFKELLKECYNYSHLTEGDLYNNTNSYSSASHQKLPGETVGKPQPIGITDLLRKREEDDNHAPAVLPIPLNDTHLERLGEVYGTITSLKGIFLQASEHVNIKDDKTKLGGIRNIISRMNTIQNEISSMSKDLNKLHDK